jgi:hypothetical protein
MCVANRVGNSYLNRERIPAAFQIRRTLEWSKSSTPERTRLNGHKTKRFSAGDKKSIDFFPREAAESVLRQVCQQR